MNKAELFRSLSSVQITEFEKDINAAIEKVLVSKNETMPQLSKLKVHLRLENKIFLHVRMTINNRGQILKDHFDIIRFNTVDQFLDSLLEVKKFPKV